MAKKLLMVIIIFAVLSLFFLIRSDNGKKLDLQLSGNSFFEGLKIVNRKNGVTDWILTAKRADMSKDGREALLSGIEMKLENQGMTVSADRGVYDMETRQISVEGMLHASNKAYELRTSRALIDGKKGIFDTAGTVRINGKKFQLEGIGMQADNFDHKVRILKDVKATFNR